jgi:Tfp pilus assembly protein PilX
MALLTVLLVCMLATALMAGMFAAVMSDQRSQGFDRDQSQAYAAAHAGLEKLTTQLAQLFVTDFSPNASQIAAASATPPSIYGFTRRPATSARSLGFGSDSSASRKRCLASAQPPASVADLAAL